MKGIVYHSDAFAELYRHYRFKNESVSRFAKRFGFSKQRYDQYMKHVNEPRVSVIAKVASRLGITDEKLFFKTFFKREK